MSISPDTLPPDETAYIHETPATPETPPVAPHEPVPSSITEIRDEESFVNMSDFIRFFRDLVIVLLIALFIRFVLVTPFQISGSSMETSYHDGEFIIVNKFSYFMLGSYRIGDPRRGDVVVLMPHVSNEKQYYIKRVLGLPGDTIKFEGGDVFIETKGSTKFIKLQESYLSPMNKGKTFLPTDVSDRSFTVPADSYWVMGDNRNNSSDSRTCFRSCMIDGSVHFVARDNVVGSVLLDLGAFSLFGSPTLHVGAMRWVYQPRFLDTPRNWSYTELNQ